MNRADTIKALCAQRGIKIRPRGRAFHVRGKDVDIMVADLAILTEHDLHPAGGQKFLSTIAQGATARWG